MAITPSQYLKSVRRDFQHLPAGVCDEVLADIEKSGFDSQQLRVPNCIPEKYQAQMQKTWTVLVLRRLFANASRKYSIIQRHKILQKSL